MNTTKKIYEYGIVKHSLDVHFTAAAGTADYGQILIPQGTKVERFCENGMWSDWFVTNPEDVCPMRLRDADKRPNSFYMHDAIHYGIRVPQVHLATDQDLVEEIKKRVIESKATNTYLKVVAVKNFRELTGACLADAVEWANSHREAWQV